MDSNTGVYTVANSVLGLILQYSPFEIQRQVYQKSLLEHGGFYPNAFVPPDVMELIQSGTAVTLLADDTLAPYQHQVILSKQIIAAVPVGYHYQRNLPMQKEIDKGLQNLLEAGVTGRVSINLPKVEWIFYVTFLL